MDDIKLFLKTKLWNCARVVLMAIVFSSGCSSSGSSGSAGAAIPLTDVTRPRIWLTPAKITQVQTKARVDVSGNATGGTVAPEWTGFINTVASVKTSGSYYGMSAWHFALAYKITKDTAYRDRALALADAVIVNMTDERFDSGLYGYASMEQVALIYDWLYTELGATRKANYIAYMVNFLNEWWNPAAPAYTAWAKEDPLNNYYWHHMYATALAAVALYGDDNSSLKLVTGGITYTTPLEFWNAKIAQATPRLNQYGNGGGWHEGMPYGQVSMEMMYRAFLVMKPQRNYFSELAFPAQTVSFLLHALQPNGTDYFATGDLPNTQGGGITPAYRLNLQFLAEGLQGTTASQWAQYWTETTYNPTLQGYMYPDAVMWRDTSRPASNPRTGLPLGYWAPGYGWFTWRTSQTDANAVQLSFLSTDNFQSHQHRNQNSFWISYRGWQVSNANLYEPSGINQDVHLENTYVIGGSGQYRPNGGSNVSAGQILRQGYANDYGYVKGDATKAYLSPDLDNGSPLLNAYYRSILTTGKYTLVYDRVSPKTSSAVTDYYLHFANALTINGTTASSTNGAGMVFHKTLYPLVNIASGNDSVFVAGSTGRFLKVTPQVQLVDNYMLNVIEVAPSGTSTQTATTLIEGGGLRGAFVADATENKVIMFSATSLEISGGSYSVSTTAASRHYISDLPASTQFNVFIDGSPAFSGITSSAGVLSFSSSMTGAHTYSISPAGQVSTQKKQSKSVFTTIKAYLQPRMSVSLRND